MKQFFLRVFVASIIFNLAFYNCNSSAQTVRTYVAGINTSKGITVDTSGNVYVLNGFSESKITKILPNGVFSTPYIGIQHSTAIVSDKSGNLYISAATHPWSYVICRILKISNLGVKSTLVDSGSGLKSISALAINSLGELYVADKQNNAIYKVSSSGVVTPFVTSVIGSPTAMTFDNNDNLFVINSSNNMIVKITPSGVVSSFYNGGLINTLNSLSFNKINSFYVATKNNIYTINNSGVTIDSIYSGNYSDVICTDLKGNIYMGNNNNYSISKISNTKSVSYLVPPNTYPNMYYQSILIDGQNNLYFGGSKDDSVKFNAPFNYYLKHYLNKLNSTGTISRLCDLGYCRSIGVMIKDSFDSIYMATDSAILSISKNGLVTNYVSTNIENINTLVKDKSGNFYISTDRPQYINGKYIYDSVLYKISPSKVVIPFVKLPNTIYYSTVDDSDNIYVSCDNVNYNSNGNNGIIYKIDKKGNKTVLLSKGTALVKGMVFDKNRNLYFSSHRLNKIQKLSPSGILTTVVDNGLYGPASLALDNKGDLYVHNDTTFIINKIILQPLPIKLIAFKAKAQEKIVVTNWQTASELAAKGFAIQRSADGLSFKTIGQVSAKGKGANEYSFTDFAPANGLNFYRLQMIDNDGTISFSKTEKVVFNIEEGNYSLFPNPAKNIVTINGKSISNISIFNSEGFLQIKKELKEATNPTINVSALSKGFYFLHVESKMGNQAVLTLIKE